MSDSISHPCIARPICEAHHRRGLHRREFIGRAAQAIGAGAVLGGTQIGCVPKTEPSTESATTSPSAPLRIALLATGNPAEAIRRAWSAVSDQPIDLDVAELDRAQVADTTSLLTSAKRADVLIYPLAMVGEATSSDIVIDFSDSDLSSIESANGPLMVGLRNATRFSGRVSAIPLGAQVPALMSTTNTSPLRDWNEYDRWVAEDLNGKAAEPLAAGWAAAMFLWRAASMTQGTWLFGRENLQPVIAEDTYVSVLEQLAKTANRYQASRLTPKEIWKGLADGQIMAGIGFPQSIHIDGVSIGNLPGDDQSPRVLLDMYTPVVSISSGCRQSMAAKQFITWLCGGDGSENLRQQVPSLTRTRTARLNVDSESETGQHDQYDAWLAERMKTTMTLPAIQLHAATKYYQALDQQVGRCLDGKANPAEALGEAAKQWQAITTEVGTEQQMRQWRRCQGMRA
tara:strand:+ start:579957 stop:581327 length:1371 start_codon:yes stop_codon:yes gene_type:complete